MTTTLINPKRGPSQMGKLGEMTCLQMLFPFILNRRVVRSPKAEVLYHGDKHYCLIKQRNTCLQVSLDFSSLFLLLEPAKVASKKSRQLLNWGQQVYRSSLCYFST